MVKSGKKNTMKALCLIFVFAFIINTFAAVVSDNDGSAFITKAEFDSLKNDFQAQIDNYNTSIDAKIDGAIAAYLSGIKISNVAECENLLEKINNGGNSGIDLCWGLDGATYINDAGVLEANQFYAAVGSQIPSSALIQENIIFTNNGYFDRLKYIYFIDSDTNVTSPIAPNLNWMGMNHFCGRDGMSSWVVNGTVTTNQLYTWLNYSGYVNPFGLNVSLPLNKVRTFSKNGNMSGSSWGFTESSLLKVDNANFTSAWNHDVDFITNPSTEYCFKASKKDDIVITGQLSFYSGTKTSSKQIVKRSDWLTSYNGSALETISSGDYLWTGRYGSSGNWYNQSMETPQTNIKRYKGVGVKLTTNTQILKLNMNDYKWENLTKIVETCQSPSYGIPIYKVPKEGECSLKLKVDNACNITMYTGETGNKTWKGSDNDKRLPNKEYVATKSELDIKFNAKKDDYIFMVLQPSYKNVKLTEMSCSVTGE